MKQLVESVQFFNGVILAKYSIVGLIRCNVDYPPNLHCPKNASPCDMLH